MDIMEQFLDVIKKYKIISIIGMAKNVGKTTTLNHMIKNLNEKYILGLTSIGRDGEKYDVITQLPKPRIYIRKGTFVATAEKCYSNSNIKMKLIKKTGFNTPLGDISIFKAINSGYIELAGPSINKYLSVICTELINLGCDVIFVDGAFDRRSYATPLIADAVIVSTGASVSGDIKKVVGITAHAVKLLTLENESNDEILKLARNISKNLKIGIINANKSIETLDVLTALGTSKDIIKKLNEDSEYLVINGAITDQLLEDLIKFIKKIKKITLLVKDATKLFISRKALEKFQKNGGILKVLNPIKIIAVTANPTTPTGLNFNKKKFLILLKERINVPVYDLGPND